VGYCIACENEEQASTKTTSSGLEETTIKRRARGDNMQRTRRDHTINSKPITRIFIINCLLAMTACKNLETEGIKGGDVGAYIKESMKYEAKGH